MEGEVRAPETDVPGLVWFNTPAPLALKDMRGRLVILDFWTFGCINCMHILPTLRRVEEAYPEDVVVIGVHSPKFAAERDPAQVAAAIRRYGIVHPVAHDPDFKLWRAYAVRAWPTLVFVAPDGSVLGQQAGEPDPERLLAGIKDALDDWRAGGKLKPAALVRAAAPEPPRRFLFPGKLKPVPGTPRRWALADGGHHQIVLLNEDGGELARLGSGHAGRGDGAATEASFNGPQGLIATDAAIYVADTGNHLIRRIDIASGAVATLSGTGHRGRALGAPAPALQTALASPWDLEIDGNRLLIANAGTHQLGVLDLAEGSLAALAGTGAEAIVDGPAAEAVLAQPSGLALDPEGRALYVADSESSAIRRLDLDGKRAITTVIGTGLFDFGHVNGALAEGRLQHPLGVAWWAGRLAVADTYNSVLRLIDLQAQTIADLDDGFLCADPICLLLAEPAGVIAAGPTRLLVVDTNNHRIVEVDTALRQTRTWGETLTQA